MKTVRFLPAVTFILLYFFGGCKSQHEMLSSKETIDTLKFNVVKIDRNYGPCEDKYENCLSIKISYPEFYSNTPNKFISSINDTIREHLLKHGIDKEKAETLDSMIEQFYENYKSFKKDFPDYNIGWNYESVVSIILNKNNILSLAFDDFSFLGGAHPISTKYFENYDVETANKISLSDLFKSNFENTLTNIAEEEFRSVRQIPAAAKYDSLGYWFENNVFRLNNNFAVGDSCITFYYNSYEIAPYAWGQTQIDLPYKKLNAIIKNEGLLSRIIYTE